MIFVILFFSILSSILHSMDVPPWPYISWAPNTKELTKKRTPQEELFYRLGESVEKVNQLLDKDTLVELLMQGANLNEPNEHGILPLDYAVMFYPPAVALLLEHGADVNGQGKDGGTALTTAVIMGRLKAAEILLVAGADMNIKSDFGCTPLRFAQDSPTMLALFQKNAKRTESSGNVINKQHKDKRLPRQMLPQEELAYRIKHCLLDDEKDLIKLVMRGADVNKCWDGQLPLHSAARHYAPVIPLLLKYGAKINAHNSIGDAALVAAIFAQNKDSIRCLLDAGADMYSAGKLGSEPFGLAKNFSNIFPLFQEAQAKIDAKSLSFIAAGITFFKYNNFIINKK